MLLLKKKKVRKAGPAHLEHGHVSSCVWGWAQFWVTQILGGQNCTWQSVWEGRKKKWKSDLGRRSPMQMLLVNEHVNVHSTISHNNLNLETTKMLAYAWKNRQIVAYPYNGILCTNEKEWSPSYATMWMNPCKCVEEAKEDWHKSLHIVWFHLYEMSRIGKSMETENRLVVA